MSGSVISLVSEQRALLYNMVVEQGTDLEFPITLVDDEGVEENMSGYTASMRVRPYTESDTVYFEMTTDNDRISTDTGKIVLIFSATDFSAASWRNGVYDLNIVSPGGKRERLMEGTFTIGPEVTR